MAGGNETEFLALGIITKSIYSDDGGKTFGRLDENLFLFKGTGEAAIEELA